MWGDLNTPPRKEEHALRRWTGSTDLDVFGPGRHESAVSQRKQRRRGGVQHHDAIGQRADRDRNRKSKAKQEPEASSEPQKTVEKPQRQGLARRQPQADRVPSPFLLALLHRWHSWASESREAQRVQMQADGEPQARPAGDARRQRRQRQIQLERLAVEAQQEPASARTAPAQARTVERLHRAETHQQILEAWRERPAMRHKSAAKDGETLPEKVAVSEGGRTLEMTADQLDAVTAARRHHHGEAAEAQLDEEAVAEEAAAELEGAAKLRWEQLEQELAAAAADPSQPAPHFQPRGAGGGEPAHAPVM